MRRKLLPDRELVQKYLDGDHKALEVLIHRHKEKVFASIIVFTKDRALAEDLFQDTFIKAIDKLQNGKYKEEGKFLPWIMRMSYNVCIDHYRKAKRRIQVTRPLDGDFDLPDTTVPMGINSEEVLIKKKLNQEIRSLLEYIPPKQKEVMLLRHFYDFKFKEIAELTGVGLNTTMSRRRRAFINLRRIVSSPDVAARLS